MTYPFIFYVDRLPPDVGGCANGFVIRILKKYKDDRGIIKHELCHVRQWFQMVLLGAIIAAIVAFAPTSQYPEYWFVPLIVGCALHSLMYRLCASYRLWAEVVAYKEQSLHYDDDRRLLFAGYISQFYKLNVTTERAYKELTT